MEHRHYLLPSYFLKGGVEHRKEAEESCSEVSCLKGVCDRVLGGIKGGGGKALGPWGRRWGLSLRAYLRHRLGWGQELQQWPVPEKEGRKEGVRWGIVELDLELLQGDWE